jgi:hypothetical protein
MSGAVASFAAINWEKMQTAFENLGGAIARERSE